MRSRERKVRPAIVSGSFISFFTLQVSSTKGRQAAHFRFQGSLASLNAIAGASNSEQSSGEKAAYVPKIFYSLD